VPSRIFLQRAVKKPSKNHPPKPHTGLLISRQVLSHMRHDIFDGWRDINECVARVG
jgi:hypothetical protein